MQESKNSSAVIHTLSAIKQQAQALEAEASYFAAQDNNLRRLVSWGSIPLYQRLINKEFNARQLVRGHLAEVSKPRALTLACGDMSGEYQFLNNAAEVVSIDAYDISEGQRQKFLKRQDLNPDIEINYQISDVNKIELPQSSYDIVFVQQAYHHFEALEHIADQIHNTLKPDGIFVIIDYIGANYLQRTGKQKKVSQEIWSTLPERLRTTLQGDVREYIHVPDIDSLPPFEAIRSEDILDVLSAKFKAEELFTYAGILFPLLEGFAQNYTDQAEDQSLLQNLWDLDRQLLQEGKVEPNFMRAILKKKNTGA